MAIWLANVPNHPAALVVFDQMVRRDHPLGGGVAQATEHVSCWFLKGSAKITMLQIARKLSANGHAALGPVECLTGIVKD